MKCITMLAAITLAAAGTHAFAEEGAAKAGAPRVTDEIVSPEAASAVDEAELIGRLTGEDTGETVGAKLDRIVGRMGDSAMRLKKVDPGAVTQETQRRIMADLDVLIEMARKSECSGGSQKPAGRGTSKVPGKTERPGGTSGGGNTPAGNESMRNGDATAAPGATVQDMSRDRWYWLPDTDRDGIVQGMKEAVLPTYEMMMAKFYETLSKTNKPR